MPLTSEQEADYLRAAVALETHEILPDPDGTLQPWAVIAWKAWNMINKEAPRSVRIVEIDLAAARLLRERIKKGEPLP